MTQQDPRPFPSSNVHLRISGWTAIGIVMGFFSFGILAYLSANAQDMGQSDPMQTNPALHALTILFIVVFMLVAPAVVLVELVVGLRVRRRDRQNWRAEQLPTMPTTLKRRGSWYQDPLHRHRLRYYDNGWTKWAADADVMVDDSEAIPDIEAMVARRRRNRVLLIVALCVAALLLFGWNLITENSSTSAVSKSKTEMNGWKLPTSVKYASEKVVHDPVLGDTVTRLYTPVGVPSGEAVLNLVNALHDQGYTFTMDQQDGVWFAHCNVNTSCEVDIGLDEQGQRVEVTVYPSG
jgi:hypothetical protein